MRIILVGYRGCGKTTVGRFVAKELGWPFADVDREMESRYQTPMLEIYTSLGETGFRRVETEIVRTLCHRDPCVIAFGAGTIIQQANQIHARKNSLVVYLETTAPVLWQRIESDPLSARLRPRLTSGGYEEVIEMMAKRAPVYQACADLSLDATRLPQDLACEIVGHFTVFHESKNANIHY